MSTNQYPRASLLGLPLELRLIIYSKLAGTIHTHIEYMVTEEGYYMGNNWRQRSCTCPDSTFPQLCSRPAFSGLHASKDTCEPTSPDQDTRFAIRRVCKLIYNESHNYFNTSKTPPITSISVGGPFITWTINSLFVAHLAHIRRLTLTASDYHCPFVTSVCAGHLWYPVVALDSLVNLDTIAIQAPVPHYKFYHMRFRQPQVFSPETTWRNLTSIKQLEKIFSPTVTVVLEAWMCVPPGHVVSALGSKREEMIVLRGVVWGAEDKSASKAERKTTCEVRRREVVSEEENEEWRKWWVAKGLFQSETFRRSKS